MLIKRHRINGQRGDTIVEVLISVAVVSLVLAGAYAITNRNIASSQETQERGQAQQIAQQQLEMMRVLSSKMPPVTIPIASPANCIKITAGVPAPASVQADCLVDSSGATPCVGDPCYTIGISNGGANIYGVSVSWSNLHGTISTVSLDYGL